MPNKARKVMNTFKCKIKVLSNYSFNNHLISIVDFRNPEVAFNLHTPVLRNGFEKNPVYGIVE